MGPAPGRREIRQAVPRHTEDICLAGACARCGRLRDRPWSPESPQTPRFPDSLVSWPSVHLPSVHLQPGRLSGHLAAWLPELTCPVWPIWPDASGSVRAHRTVRPPAVLPSSWTRAALGPVRSSACRPAQGVLPLCLPSSVFLPFVFLPLHRLACSLPAPVLRSRIFRSRVVCTKCPARMFRPRIRLPASSSLKSCGLTSCALSRPARAPHPVVPLPAGPPCRPVPASPSLRPALPAGFPCVRPRCCRQHNP